MADTPTPRPPTADTQWTCDCHHLPDCAYCEAHDCSLTRRQVANGVTDWIMRGKSTVAALNREPAEWWDDEHCLDNGHAAVIIAGLVATVERLQAENAALLGQSNHRGAVLSLQRQRAQLRAEVDRLTANLATTTSQRDAAEAVIARLDEQWEPNIDGQLWTQLMYGADNHVRATDEPMSDAEHDAFCRATQARAAQPQEPT